MKRQSPCQERKSSSFHVYLRLISASNLIRVVDTSKILAYFNLNAFF